MNLRIRKCPDCGARVWANMKFCGQCGHKMEEVPPVTAEGLLRAIRDELRGKDREEAPVLEKEAPAETMRWPVETARIVAPEETDEGGNTLGRSFLIGAIAAAAVVVVIAAAALIARMNRPVAPREEPEAVEAVHMISANEETAPPEEGGDGEDGDPAALTEDERDALPAKASVTPPPDQGDFVYVIPAGLNLRAGPGTGYGIVDSVEKGEPLRRTGTEGEWTRVFFNGRECYVLSSLVTEEAPEGAVAPTAAPTERPVVENVGSDDKRGIVVTNHGANVRSGPGTEYGVIDSVLAGVELRTTGETDGWSRVEYDGRAGYISNSLLDIIQPADPDLEPDPGDSFRIAIQGKANIRTGPGTQYDILGAVEEGDVLESSGQEGNWYVITFHGQIGYVPANLAERY